MIYRTTKITLSCLLFILQMGNVFANEESSDSASHHQNIQATKTDKPKQDLPNFHEVHSFLYRGGEPTQVGLNQLKDKGIKTIIDLRAQTEQAIAEKKLAHELGMKYINLTMTSAPPTKKQVETVLSEIKKAQSDPDKGAVFLHCAHGSDRTGCMIGIWRVTQEGWTYEDAYKEMRKYYFTPKFTKLSGSVKEYADKAKN